MYLLCQCGGGGGTWQELRYEDRVELAVEHLDELDHLVTML